MMRYILYAILVYLAYRFIFHFVIPIYFASRKIRKGFKEMRSRMEEQMNPKRADASPPSAEPQRPKPASEDYLDYEEVR
jgi:hypothetical protein